MLIRKKIIIFTLFLISFNLFSQNFDIEGRVVSKDSTVVIEGLHIFNNNTKRGNITDYEGFFTITVKVGDTITISGLQIEKIKKVIQKDDQLVKEIEVFVSPKTNQLDEVIIVNSLSGSIYIDSKLVKKENVVNAESLKLPYAGYPKKTQTERAIYTATTGPGGGIPLDPIINWISGYLKKLKKRKRIEDEAKLINKLKENFKNYLSSDLQIKENNFDDFLYFCYEDKTFKSLYEKGEIYLIELFKKKALIYKNRSK